jgi:hypothetical protein
MDTEPNPTSYTLEDLRDPEKRTVCEEANSVKYLQKNLSSALGEARQAIESFKEVSGTCNKEFVVLREKEEQEIGGVVPSIHEEVEKLIDLLREEMVAQTSENMKMYKQVQILVKEKTTLQQLTAEAVGKVDKAEGGLQVR